MEQSFHMNKDIESIDTLSMMEAFSPVLCETESF
jgi:hypothetical protein